MDYYSLDSILEDEEKLEVLFPYDIDTFGMYINPSLTTIRKNVKADVPIFLIKFLLQNEFCTICRNPYEILKNDLEADSSYVNLKNKHFFLTARHIADKKKLVEFFYERIGCFIGLILKSDFCEDDLLKLSFGERKLLIKARKSFRKFEDFSNNTGNDD